MFTVPVDASVMPVPEPVPPVVIVTCLYSFWYAVDHVPNSGNSSVLPVSVIEAGDEAGAAGSAAPCIFAADGDELGLLPPPPLLLQAATVAASGMRTAAASGRGILLLTENFSFWFSARA